LELASGGNFAETIRKLNKPMPSDDAKKIIS
jgi:hypothetical protein